MAITREDLQNFKEEKERNLRLLSDRKQLELKELEEKVSAYRQHLNTELEHRYEVKTAEINAELRILEQIIKKEEEL